jgi:hypothetical protein
VGLGTWANARAARQVAGVFRPLPETAVLQRLSTDGLTRCPVVFADGLERPRAASEPLTQKDLDPRIHQLRR